jgi:pyrimidine-nucleoside phosphorylase
MTNLNVEKRTNELFLNILDSISQKRNKNTLSSLAIETIVRDFVAGNIPDYQMSAWLATVASVGMDIEELESLTRAYVVGGVEVDHSGFGCKVVDKHSTGGVGDKVTFVVVPIVAACGVPVTKISGRGLGHAGGTLDKLESLTGLKLDLSAKEAREILKKTGMVMTGQSSDLAPGDKATYQLRDISGTVESIPLIAASIISKKIATGADCLVLDVKTGSGALIQDYDQSIQLAETMVELASRFDINCRAVISDMSQPLGYAVGNSLEIKEALDVLQGKIIPGLTELSCVLARLMLQVVNPSLNEEEADAQVMCAILSGAAYEKLITWARTQGADEKQLLNPQLLPTAQHTATLIAEKSGWIQAIDPRTIGNASLHLGANRHVKGGSVMDHSAGVILHKRVGDRVVKGESLCEIHYNNSDISIAKDMIRSAFKVGEICPSRVPIVHQII